MTRAPVVRGLGVISGWGRGTAALPEDAARRGGGRPVLSLGRLARRRRVAAHHARA